MKLTYRLSTVIRTTLMISALFALTDGAAQSAGGTYSELNAKGLDCYNKKDYRNGAAALSKAFDIIIEKYRGYENIRYEAAYNAACCWALYGQPDSAFAALNRIVPIGRFTDIQLLMSDNDLVGLHPDSRWTAICNQVKANKQQAEATLDKDLAEKLKLIRDDDQKYRTIYDALRKRRDPSGFAFEEQSLLKLMKYRDSVNEIIVSRILDSCGWLGPDKAGFLGTQTLFLVIQHAPLNMQEKYLPVMQQAVKEGKALARDLAFLEDRVALRQGKKQLYGSQTWIDRGTGKRYVQPVEDPEHLEERRAAVWLEPMSEYLGYTWDPAAYIKMLPEIEQKIKK